MTYVIMPHDTRLMAAIPLEGQQATSRASRRHRPSSRMRSSALGPAIRQARSWNVTISLASATPPAGSAPPPCLEARLRVRSLTPCWRGESPANPSLARRFPGNSVKYKELRRFRSNGAPLCLEKMAFLSHLQGNSLDRRTGNFLGSIRQIRSQKSWRSGKLCAPPWMRLPRSFCGSSRSGSIPHRPSVVHRCTPSPSRLAPNDNGCAEGDRLQMALVLRKPLEKEQQGVDLVVVTPARKGEELVLEIGEP